MEGWKIESLDEWKEEKKEGGRIGSEGGREGKNGGRAGGKEIIVLGDCMLCH